MGVRFACHACGRRLNIKQQLAGRRGRCPGCGVWFRVPIEDADTSQPADPVEPTAQPVRSTGPGEDPLRRLDVDPAAQWYVRPPTGGQYGPASGPLLRQWVAEERIGPDSLLWRDGWSQWREARDVLPEFFALPSPPPTHLPPPKSPAVAVAKTGAVPNAGTAPKAGATSAAPAVRPAPSAAPTVSSAAPTVSSAAPTVSSATDPALTITPGVEPPGAVRRKRTSRRATVVALLLAASLLLVGALVVVLMVAG